MKRILIIIAIIFAVLVAATLIGGPYYAKYYIEENDKELVGRSITMDRLHFNALTGKLLITEFTLFEKNDSTSFVHFDTLATNFTIYKLLGGHFWSDFMHLKGLDLNIEKNIDQFNFDDLIPEADTTQVEEATDEDPFLDQITVNDIQILRSGVQYQDHELEVEHIMQDINIKLPGISIGDEQTQAGLEFAFTDGGSFRTNLDYNLVENAYRWELEIDQLNLNPFTRYVQESMHINNLQGWFSGNVLVLGDIDEPEVPVISGSMNLNDFAITDTGNVEVLGFSSIFMDAEELNVGTGNYHFGKLNINRLVVNGVIDEESDNLRRLIKEVEKATDTVAVVETTPEEETPITYLLDEFRLNDGELNITDQTLQSRPFNYSIQQLNFAADNLTEGQMVTFDMDALMNGKGTLTGHVVTDPGNPGNGTFDFALKNTRLADFSPYCEDATAYPITDGIMSFQTENTIVNNHLNSHLVLNMFDTELADKRKDIDPDVKVPLKLGLVVLEDSKGRINIDVPAEGDIDDPEFRYSKLVWKVVLNVLVKAATSPYNLLANSLGVDEEQLQFIRLELLQEELGPEQIAQLDLLTKLLADKPDLTMIAKLNINEEEEGEAVRDYIARKGFYLQREYGNDSAQVTISPVDKIKIMEIEEDEKFDKFLAKKLNVSLDSLKQKDLIDMYASEAAIALEQTRLNDARRVAMRTYVDQHPEVAARLIISEETTFEGGKKRPRFMLTYDISESPE